MTAQTSKPTLWARVFALFYDPVLWWAERASLRALRADLLARAAGRTVEIGGGTGLNLPHYPDDLAELVITEPDGPMRTRLNRRLRTGRQTPRRPDEGPRQAHPQHPQHPRVLGASAENLPFPDATVDTVVTTLVLCTVDAPDDALREIVRVLRPGGRLLFLEHVRSDSPRLARRQDRFEEPWRRFAQGCRCNRPTVETIRGSGLEIELLQKDVWRGMPSFMRPLIMGMAVRSDL